MKVSPASIFFISWAVWHVKSEVSWLPCLFVDQDVSAKPGTYANKTFQDFNFKLVHKDIVLQFGHPREQPLNANSTTFLVSGKVDMRKFLTDPLEQMSCEISRHIRGKPGKRWPKLDGQRHDVWFECLLRDTRSAEATTIVKSYLRLNPTEPMAEDLPDFLNWPPIRDGQTVPASVALVLQSKSPKVRVGLKKEQKLHCQFAVDHKAPDVTVEWHHWPGAAGRTKLFSYSKRSRVLEGHGVDVTGIASGDATFTILATEMKNEGKYVCSVNVPPVKGTFDVALDIVEPPYVSLTRDGGTLVCTAGDFYPLDVHFKFFKDSNNGSGIIEAYGGILHKSHTRDNANKMYTSKAFVKLQPSPEKNGRYMCEVTHISLDKPSRVSIEVSDSWMDVLVSWPGLAALIVLILFIDRVLKWRRAKKKLF